MSYTVLLDWGMAGRHAPPRRHRARQGSPSRASARARPPLASSSPPPQPSAPYLAALSNGWSAATLCRMEIEIATALRLGPEQEARAKAKTEEKIQDWNSPFNDLQRDFLPPGGGEGTPKDQFVIRRKHDIIR